VAGMSGFPSHRPLTSNPASAAAAAATCLELLFVLLYLLSLPSNRHQSKETNGSDLLIYLHDTSYNGVK